MSFRQQMPKLADTTHSVVSIRLLTQLLTNAVARVTFDVNCNLTSKPDLVSYGALVDTQTGVRRKEMLINSQKHSTKLALAVACVGAVNCD